MYFKLNVQYELKFIVKTLVNIINKTDSGKFISWKVWRTIRKFKCFYGIKFENVKRDTFVLLLKLNILNVLDKE